MMMAMRETTIKMRRKTTATTTDRAGFVYGRSGAESLEYAPLSLVWLAQRRLRWTEALCRGDV